MSKKNEPVVFILAVLLALVTGLVSFVAQHALAFLILVTCGAILFLLFNVITREGNRSIGTSSCWDEGYALREKNNPRNPPTAPTLSPATTRSKSAIPTESPSSDVPGITITFKYPGNDEKPDLGKYGIPVISQLRLVYLDENNQEVERDVEVESFDGQGHFIGYCPQLEDTIIFYNDRVISCIDVVTGEVATSIDSYFWRKWENTGSGYMGKLLKEEKDALRSLFYSCKADGYFRKAKRALFYDAIRELATTEEFTDSDIVRLIDCIELPTSHAYKLALGRLHKNHPSTFDLVYKYSSEIFHTHKKLHQNETDALRFLKKKSKQKYTT